MQISHYATVCCRRLDRIGSHGRKQAKRPTEDEVEQARVSITFPTMTAYFHYDNLNIFKFRIKFYATACSAIP